MGWSHGNHWNDDKIQKELLEFKLTIGRMPSVGELKLIGKNDLSCAISRSGGFRYWALKMGLEQKGTETHRGQKWERHEATFFRKLGFDVEEQSVRAPFDLLVNGYRVDVKSSVWKNYGRVKGYFYNGFKQGKECDFFNVLCIEENNVLYRFIIPAITVKSKSLTIARSSIYGDNKRNKWYPYKNAIHYLEQ